MNNLILKIPSAVNLDKLFSPLEGKRTDYANNVKNGAIILLNRLYDDGSKDKLYKNDSLYFFPINYDEYNSLFSYRLKDVLNLFENYTPKILYCDKSYEPKVISMGYRLDFSLMGPEFTLVPLFPGNVKKRLLKSQIEIQNRNAKNKNKDKKKIDHLLKQFNDLKLEIDPQAYDFLENYKLTLLKAVEKWKKKDLSIYYKAHEKIGFIMHSIELVKKNKHTPTISNSDLRFQSIFTKIKKEIRSFIMVDGKRFKEFDISASHPYFFGAILNKRFFTSTTSKFSLYKIYNLLYNKLKNINKVKKGGTTQPYMTWTFLEMLENSEFGGIPFEYGFYSWVQMEIKSRFPEVYRGNENLKDIDFIKSQTLLFFNDAESRNRKNNTFIKLICEIFPKESALVEFLLYKKNIKSPLSFLLSRVESFIVQQVVAKRLITEYPHLKIFTIHDCFFIQDYNLDDLETINFIKNIMEDSTGIRPMIKIKSNNINLGIDEIVKADLEKIEKKSSKSFNSNEIRFIINSLKNTFKGVELDNEIKKFHSFILN